MQRRQQARGRAERSNWRTEHEAVCLCLLLLRRRAQRPRARRGIPLGAGQRRGALRRAVAPGDAAVRGVAQLSARSDRQPRRPGSRCATRPARSAWIEKKALGDKRTVLVTAPAAEVRQRPRTARRSCSARRRTSRSNWSRSRRNGWLRVRHATARPATCASAAGVCRATEQRRDDRARGAGCGRLGHGARRRVFPPAPRRAVGA